LFWSKSIIFLDKLFLNFRKCLNNKDEAQVEFSNKLYNELTNLGIDTVLDDRNERPGIKFNDMDLIGVPIRVVVGKGLVENQVEVKLRKEDTAQNINTEKVIDYIKEIISNN